mmetsp:Transcript_22169/g.33288  ORF Transcript_22169/g.33288 Transcript_22169/m.33288 type:complete len:237 (-) Transcript_22169:17-727(-)
MRALFAFGILYPAAINGLQVSMKSSDCRKTEVSRRSFVSAFVSTATALSIPAVSNAGIDVNTLKALPVEGDNSGVTTRLRQIEAEKNRPEDTVDKVWEKLEDGVQFREYREGRGEAVVQDGSKVGVEMTIRCKSFSTAQEPGGIKYFTTKDDTEFNEIAFTVGSGQILPELEEGMKGMKKGAVRRIEVPTQYVYAARKANQLPLPSDKNKDGKRRFENLFKTDATLIFEVLVTRVK